ncbi:MAG TPA: DEAD/DEAH box helicase [Candidatus Bilamarchaeum sp.]|nr:DEAD/DEAH box helicase [Candidatus Bilamarchaeum sp.]
MKFSELSISPRTMSALSEMGYEDATEVQEKTIPLLMQGEDIMVRSQTGTGKTAAFGIGLIEILTRDRTKKALILAPTRELAVQITMEIRSIAKNHNMHIFAVYGGTGMGSQTSALRRGFDILVATPGRLLDHIQQGNVRLAHVNCVVLDEADRMLDIGFRKDIDRIMKMTNPQRQVLLFSATFSHEIRELSRSYMNVPVSIEVGPVGSVAKITEEAIHLSRAEKLDRLREILLREPMSRTIVFVRSKRAVDHVFRKLLNEGIDARSIHGDKTQSQRERAVRDFQEGRTRILVATDVAARGIHIDDVNHVINYDEADTPDTHTHRIGRTGRMGKEGKATTFKETDPLPPKQRGQGGRGGGRFGNRPSHGGHSSGGHGGNPYGSRPRHRPRRY